MSNASNNIIQIKCTTKDYLPLNSLKDFQGDLKTLSDANYKKLRKQIEKHGFCVPFFVWQDGENNFILDGHQREKVLNRMLNDGVNLPDKFPVVFVEAKNRKDAKEKLLAINSQYGKMDEVGLYNFLEDCDLNFNIVKNFELPTIDLDIFNSLVNGENIDNEKKEKEYKEIDVKQEFLVIVECKDENEQLLLLEKFEEEGLKCKAVIS